MNFIITNELHISVADYTGKSRDLNPLQLRNYYPM